jgi:hypothetical protein
MRAVPVDPDRFKLISTGNVTAMIKWVELSDGSRRPDPQGRPETDDQDRALWSVECIAPGDPDDTRDRTGVVEVVVAGKDRPDPGAFGDILTFEQLVMAMPYVSRKTGSMSSPRFTATGIRRSGKPAHQQAAA